MAPTIIDTIDTLAPVTQTSQSINQGVQMANGLDRFMGYLVQILENGAKIVDKVGIGGIQPKAQKPQQRRQTKEEVMAKIRAGDWGVGSPSYMKAFKENGGHTQFQQVLISDEIEVNEPVKQEKTKKEILAELEAEPVEEIIEEPVVDIKEEEKVEEVEPVVVEEPVEAVNEIIKEVEEPEKAEEINNIDEVKDDGEN